MDRNATALHAALVGRWSRQALAAPVLAAPAGRPWLRTSSWNAMCRPVLAAPAGMAWSRPRSWWFPVVERPRRTCAGGGVLGPRRAARAQEKLGPVTDDYPSTTNDFDSGGAGNDQIQSVGRRGRSRARQEPAARAARNTVVREGINLPRPAAGWGECDPVLAPARQRPQAQPQPAMATVASASARVGRVATTGSTVASNGDGGLCLGRG
ncbi:hypothetical protein TRIUR3_26434 [Triticum urartu]|uniref:Uncharacterized protein n=1 Tax=Triticum urartu TaxID=4572 RepID=M7ZZB8_TRIUA|nr:uncharacterized protein LOC125551091 [Triticum urartu]EMS68503.1 hypothetical protein TRIUR3_26434 [Triticum urartu]